MRISLRLIKRLRANLHNYFHNCIDYMEYRYISHVEHGAPGLSIYGPPGSYQISIGRCRICGWTYARRYDTLGGHDIDNDQAAMLWQSYEVRPIEEATT